ncbi:Gag-Pol polyprotein [Cucumispora dikerogammari]|nr:Gag-Pol polyprotein [Cucumispora dikerogammari]
MFITDLLYLKDDEELHKRVFHGNGVELIKLEATKLHNVQHFGANRFEDVCNKFFFKIPRDIIRKVVSNCTTCRQTEPLKMKETHIHILAKRPMKKLMIDLIDMQRYKVQNEGNAWILTIIDVYSKFALVFPLVKKSGIEVSKNLESLFYTNTGHL